jgi:excisionase family DNA binding protein
VSAGHYRAPAGFLTLAEARRRLGISHTKIWMLVKQGVLTAYEDPRDRRVKLVRVEDIDRLSQPRPMRGSVGTRAHQEGRQR